MCGIVGCMSFVEGFDVSPAYIAEMRDTMVHRGPDGAGVWVAEDRRVGLGHRRLSIIDLSSSAAQPMWDCEQELVISFNGEIYNHAELREQLIREGLTQWRTDHSDTEVVLRAFRRWGIACVQRFVGMFAFALWDQRSRELWLVRDRVGIKPLYYSHHHSRLVFASEIKALLKDPQQKRAVNEKALGHYLSFLATPAPDTLFQGIKKLAPGSWLRVSSEGRMLEQAYWDPMDGVAKLDLTEEEASRELIARLRQAVEYRAVSDVPVGVFLSGGIDSSTVRGRVGDSSLNTSACDA